MAVTHKLNEINLSHLVPTKDNRRDFKGFEKSEECRQLADSIKALGVLEPILVRKHPEKKGVFEIRAGERRFRASKVAGLKTVPCLVMDIDEEISKAVTVTENMHRSNLTPMEEALSVCTLINLGMEYKAISTKLGKSFQWVARVAKMKDLIPELRAVVEGKDENHSISWSLMHWLLIARFPEESQKYIYEHLRDINQGDMTHDDLEKALSRLTKTVSLAPWLAEDTLEGCKDCSSCTKRSGANPGLFDNMALEFASENDLCLDSTCWEAKEQALLKKMMTLFKAENPNGVFVSEQWYVDGDIPALKSGEWKKANKNNEKAIPAFGLDGKNFCKSFHILKEKRPTTSNSSSGEDSPAAGGPKPLSIRRAEYHNRRKVSVVRNFYEELKIGKYPSSPSNNDILRLSITFGAVSHAWDTNPRGMSFVMESNANCDNSESLHQLLLKQAIPNLLKELRQMEAMKVSNEDQARAFFALFGLDFNALLEKAALDIPYPKAWEHLNEDGTPKKK